MASLFEAYITNLGKYNEGELVIKNSSYRTPSTPMRFRSPCTSSVVVGIFYHQL